MVVSVAAPGFGKAVEDRDVARWADAGGLPYLVRAVWTEGEAAEKGIVVSDADARNAAADPHDGLKQRNDLQYEARINLLNAALKEPVQQAAAQSVTQEEIDAFVQTHPMTSPGERRVRILSASNAPRAKAIQDALRRGVTWDRAAQRYAPKGDGPELRTSLGPPKRPLDRAIFRAKPNRITRFGRHVFKVVSEKPKGPLPIKQQRATAWEILASAAQAQATAEFDASIQAKWRPRTTCADPAASPGLCGNSPTVK